MKHTAGMYGNESMPIRTKHNMRIQTLQSRLPNIQKSNTINDKISNTNMRIKRPMQIQKTRKKNKTTNMHIIRQERWEANTMLKPTNHIIHMATKTQTNNRNITQNVVQIQKSRSNIS